MLAGFEEITGRNAGFRRVGLLHLHAAESMAKLAVTVAMLNRVGVTAKLLTPDELEADFPEISLEGVGCASWEGGAGYADPVATTEGLANAARALGAQIIISCSARELRARSGGGASVVTDRGETFEAKRLLIAAGPWTGGLLEGLGLQLPLTVERHFVATFAWGRSQPLPYQFADIPQGFYLRPEGKELFLAGPLTPEPQADPDHYSEVIAADEEERMARIITHRVANLQQAGSRGGWASLYDVSPDWQPVIGEVSEGVFVDAGTSGHGFKLAPALGGYVAALVLGGDVPELTPFAPDRFARGAALAAGYGAARIIG
jgi:glycine/D-amino acid oxidase-like deaminating enzyme